MRQLTESSACSACDCTTALLRAAAKSTSPLLISEQGSQGSASFRKESMISTLPNGWVALGRSGAGHLLS